MPPAISETSARYQSYDSARPVRCLLCADPGERKHDKIHRGPIWQCAWGRGVLFFGSEIQNAKVLITHRRSRVYVREIRKKDRIVQREACEIVTNANPKSIDATVSSQANIIGTVINNFKFDNGNY